MMHFPLFQISTLFRKKFSNSWKIFTILPFQKKFPDFHPPKFLMTFFLVIDSKFEISPLFSLFHYISPISEKLLFPPTFTNFPLISLNLRVFYILSVFFVSPYFDHDAFMHHTMHTLDAHGPRTMILYCVYQVMNIQLFCTSVFDHKKSKYIMSVLWL